MYDLELNVSRWHWHRPHLYTAASGQISSDWFHCIFSLHLYSTFRMKKFTTRANYIQNTSFFTIFLFFVCKMLKWEQKIFWGKSRDETYLHVLIPGAEDAESQSHLLTSADNIRCFDCHEETTCCIMLHKPMVLALNQVRKFIHSTMKYKVGQW